MPQTAKFKSSGMQHLMTLAKLLLISGAVVLQLAWVQLAWVQPAWAQPAFADGAKLYISKGCAACHGQQGRQPIAANYPKLAGQNAVYTAAQLKAYKDRSRTSALAGVMWLSAASLNDDQIRQIADYLQSLK